MQRSLSWLFSLLFHGILVIVLLQAVHFTPFELKDILEVDLVEMEMPKQVAHMPVPQELPSPEPVAPDAPAVAAPLPLDKTVVLDDSPPQAAPLPEPDSAMEPEPQVIKISPVKTETPKEEAKPDKIIVRKNDFVASRGHEARFGRAMMADYYSYSASEFSGQFKTGDDRVVSIIDARNTKYGRFLIYDSKNKTLRRLKQFGKYVYTIGPSVHADEPVTGSVTFLAKNDRIERFILMTDDDRIAHYPVKVHVREDDIVFPGKNTELQGHTSLPPYGEGFTGVVFVHGNLCEEPSLIKGFTRALSMRNLASLSFTPRGCESESPTPGTIEELTDDTVAALAHLAMQPQIDGNRLGLWGNGPGAIAAIKTVGSHRQTPLRFMVCLLDDTLEPDTMPDQKELAQLPIPVLWLITGRNTNKWRPFITTLEELRDHDKLPFSIVIAPLKASQDVLEAEGEQSGWVEQVTEDHAKLADSWIRNIIK
jgi:hypothetical protein